MGTELDQLRAFRAEEAKLHVASRAAARTALLAHIASRRGKRHRAPGTWSWSINPSAFRFAQLVRIGLDAVPIALGLGVVIAVWAVFFLGRGQQPPQRSEARENSSRQQLLATLGVLRRPQTRADRSFNGLNAGFPSYARRPGVLPDRSLIRLATVTPWGAPVFVVPLTPAKDRVLARELGETAALWVQGMGWSEVAWVNQLKNGGGLGPYQETWLPHGRRVIRMLTLVPDGVAKVRFYYLANGGRDSPGFILRLHGSVTVPVHNNVAVIQTSRVNMGLGLEVSYSADGRIVGRNSAWNHLKRVGSHYVWTP